MAWPRLDSGALDLKKETFSSMAKVQEDIVDLAELRTTLSLLRKWKLAIGTDGRNRTSFWPFGTKTGRNAPSGSGFIFGPAKWIRSFITPPPGRALIHRDYSQQEACIAAVLSRDPELLAACETGDVYLGVAQQLGFAPHDATSETHKAIRNQFKTVVLGIQYGLGARTLALKLGTSLYEAAEMLARLKARYRVYEDYAFRVGDYAGLNLEMTTCFGWTMQCPSGMRAKTIRNFPVQATAAEILHVACVLAERRGIEIVAPVHDALMAECDLRDVNDVSAALDLCMRDAAAVVLKGYPLGTKSQIVRPGEHYVEDRGATMFNKVKQCIKKLETKQNVSA
jgi:DNA polymerase I